MCINAFKHADRCIGSSTFCSPISVQHLSHTYDLLSVTGTQHMLFEAVFFSPVLRAHVFMPVSVCERETEGWEKEKGNKR